MSLLLQHKFMSDEIGREVTVMQWFIELAKLVWYEHENFSGGRPWGNGGWDADLYRGMVEGGFISGTPRGNGYYDDIDEDAANAMIKREVFGVLLTEDGEL